MAQMVLTAGGDVSKLWLDVALWPKRADLHVSRDADGYCELAAWLRQLGVSRIGLEASGGYDRGLTPSRGWASRSFASMPSGCGCSPGQGSAGEE
jgi:hypothetical protein